MSVHSIIYNNRKIEFELNQKNVKNINLNVKPNMVIEVSANKDVPIIKIKRFVKNKSFWILKNMEFFKKSQPPSFCSPLSRSTNITKYIRRITT